MNTLTTIRANTRRHNDRGVSLTEIIVTVFLLSIVGAIIAGTVISAMKTTRSTQSGVEGQSELNDALSRIARDISVADPILSTTPSWGTGVGNSPSSNEVWVQSTLKYNCVRTRYWVETNGSTKSLKSATQTFTGATCPDPTQPQSSPTPTVKTIIKDFKDTNTAGTAVPVFTYYDKNNNLISAPVPSNTVNKIARVKIDVGAKVRERSNGVRLSTSASLRALDGSLVTGVPLPVCVSYTSTDGTQGVIGADMTGAHTTDYVPTPVVRWRLADYGDTYTLRRRNLDGTWTTVPYVQSGTNFTATDTAMRGHHSRSFAYQLDITGPGGSTTCDLTVAAIANKPPAAPVITVTVEPNTSAGPHTSDFTTSNARITFPAVAEVEQYSLWKRPIELNNAPFAATAPPNWQYHALINAPNTTFNAAMFFDSGYEWMVVATDRDWTAPDGTVGTNSPYSNTGKTLAHNNATLIANVVTANPNRDAVASNQTGPVTHGQNRVSWWNTTDNTADGFRVFKRPTGTTTWTPASGLLPTSQTSFLDTGVPLGTRYDYTVTTYNQGPRGTSYTGTGPGDIYYGRYSNVVSILQYPDDPAYYARGTENNNAYNPDGRNSVHWPAVAGATQYKVDEYNTRAQVTGFTFYSYTLSATNYYTTDRTPRGSRQFYVVSANNATGWSPNSYDNSRRTAGVAIAYQRPNTPPMTWATYPNLNTDAATGNATVFNYTRNADDGESSEDKYCAENSGLCSYQSYRDSTPSEVEYGNTGDGVIGSMGDPSWWGTSANWNVYSCNPGGCSAPHTVPVSYYPGPYNYWVGSLGDYRYIQSWGRGGAYSVTESGDGGANYNWGYSQGAVRWDMNRIPVADDPFAYAGSGWYNEGTGQNATGWSRWNAASPGVSQQLDVRPWGTPGSVQRMAISAIANNGLSRPQSFDYSMKPAPVKFMETARSCNSNNATMWRLAGRVRPEAAQWDWRAGTIRNTYSNLVRVTTVAARNSGLGSYFTALAVDKDDNAANLNVLNGSASASNGGAFNDGAWNLDGNQDVYWMSQDFAPGTPVTTPGGIFSDSGSTWHIPKQSAVGGAMRATTHTYQQGAHATSVGDYKGVSVVTNEYTDSGAFGCPNTSFAPDLDTISRVAVVGNGSALAPSGGAGRTWGLSGN